MHFAFRGAYGVVWKAVSRKTQRVFALKKCFDAFQGATDAQRTYREIMFLQGLEGHPNIIGIQNLMEADNDMDIYIVCDYMETDLHAAIKGNILQDVHKQYILYQILKALKYMHSGELIHRDMKPSNILLNSDCSAKLCDFGLARSVATLELAKVETGTNPAMTDYVATRWYRAPELLMGSTHYTKGVDIWAVGCILGEMIQGKPTFPGKSTLDQLERVLEMTGVPLAEDLQTMKSPFVAQMMDTVAPTKRRGLEEFFPRATYEALDFLKRCFQFNPNKRANVDELLQHPYLGNFRGSEDECACEAPIDIPLDDNVRLSVRDYRDKLYQEIIKRRQKRRAGMEEDEDSPVTPPVDVVAPPAPVAPAPPAPAVVATTPPPPAPTTKSPPTTTPATTTSAHGGTKRSSNRSSLITPTTCQTPNPTHPTPGSRVGANKPVIVKRPNPMPFRGASTTNLLAAKVAQVVAKSTATAVAAPTTPTPVRVGVSRPAVTPAPVRVAHPVTPSATRVGTATRVATASALPTATRTPSASRVGVSATPGLVRSGSRPRIGSATATRPATGKAGTIVGGLGSGIRGPIKATVPMQQVRPSSGVASVQGSRLIRAPSTATLLGRTRAPSPALGKRPVVGYKR